MSTKIQFYKPKILQIPLAEAVRWWGGEFQFQEKSDGQHHFLEVGGHIFNSEKMRGGKFVVNDVVSIGGQAVHTLPLTERWRELLRLRGKFPANIELCRVGNGGEFLEAVIAAGGEGVVAKRWATPFGRDWFKAKREEVFYCRVMDLDFSTESAMLADNVTLQPRGRLALRGGKFWRVKLGSVLKVVAFGIHPQTGLLREARLDQDSPESWLVH